MQTLEVAARPIDGPAIDERFVRVQVQLSRNARAAQLERVRRQATYLHSGLSTVAAALAILDLSLLVH